MRTLLLSLLLLPLMAHAQAFQQKHLVVAFGAGAGVLHLASNRAELAEDLSCGAIRFSFAYAFAPRWSLGMHYDRLGNNAHHDLDRLRLTTYLFETGYRPWTGDRAAVECTFGLGACAAALYAVDAKLPYTSTGAAMALGFRYLHMLSNTVGWSLALDHATSSSNELLLEGGAVDSEGGPVNLQWNGQRITAGAFVRF